MTRNRQPDIRPWMLFAFPAVIAATIVAGLLLGGPAIGLLAAIVLALVIVTAAIAMGTSRGGPVGAPDAAARRAAARRFLVPLAIVAAGAAVVLATSGTARIVGWGVVAVGVTVAISLVFLEVGLSEDRARARERRQAG